MADINKHRNGDVSVRMTAAEADAVNRYFGGHLADCPWPARVAAEPAMAVFQALAEALMEDAPQQEEPTS